MALRSSVESCEHCGDQASPDSTHTYHYTGDDGPNNMFTNENGELVDTDLVSEYACQHSEDEEEEEDDEEEEDTDEKEKEKEQASEDESPPEPDTKETEKPSPDQPPSPKCVECGTPTHRVVVNTHTKYAHCSWRRHLCDKCMPDDLADGHPTALGDCIWVADSGDIPPPPEPTRKRPKTSA